MQDLCGQHVIKNGMIGDGVRLVAVYDPSFYEWHYGSAFAALQAELREGAGMNASSFYLFVDLGESPARRMFAVAHICAGHRLVPIRCCESRTPAVKSSFIIFL